MSKDLKNSPQSDPFGLLQTAAKLAKSERWEEVFFLCERVFETDPRIEYAAYLAGIACAKLQRPNDAVRYLKTAVSIDEHDTSKLSLLINLLHDVGKSDEAIPYLKRHVELSPDVDNLNRLASIYAYNGRLGEAIETFQKSLRLSPENNVASAGLYPLLRITCDWGDTLDALSNQIDTLNTNAISRGEIAPEPPFDNVHRCDDEEMNLAIANSWSQSLINSVVDVPTFTRTPIKKKTAFINIGYLSADFHEHATTHLMRGVFQEHDKGKFRVFAYSYGPDDRSEYRSDIRAACSAFVDISKLSDKDAAAKIFSDKIDILVDLKGHTRHNRLAICAMRPAPIQVTYLGYPGTSGAPFFDYAVSDITVTPSHSHKYYEENLVILRNSYQCNDNKQGLPENYFNENLNKYNIIFCSFNNPMKIEKTFFEIWMEIISSIPHSCLWILKNNDAAEFNLRKFADDFGMEERLVFAEMLPRREHLGRMAFADLALDTRYYNGHTTTSDALWAGVPVVTLEGKHFASRVSASLLRAMDLPELITSTTSEYKSRIIELATNNNRRAMIRKKITSNRLNTPLFDTVTFTRDLEATYTEMHRRFCANEPPRLLDLSKLF